jgi:GNAT superfamily N-acetyltransferase
VIERALLNRDFRLRPFAETDRAHVDTTWRRSYSDPWSDFAGIPHVPGSGLYKRIQGRAIELAMASGQTLIACAPDLDDQILGWVCARPPHVLHYVFVKEDFRGRGLGRALFEAALGAGLERVYVTHVHTALTPTALIVRKTTVRTCVDGKWTNVPGFDQAHRVPVWRMFGGVRLHYNPWLIFDGEKGPA